MQLLNGDDRREKSDIEQNVETGLVNKNDVQGKIERERDLTEIFLAYINHSLTSKLRDSPFSPITQQTSNRILKENYNCQDKKIS